jgi:hypothetical protein
MQAMKPEQREKHVAELQAQRDKITRQIKELGDKRDAYLKSSATKPSADGFDEQVVRTLQNEAARKNITYSLPETPAK